MNSLILAHIEAFIKRTSIPQLNLALWHNGELYEASFGCNKQPGIDVFEIGSIGKTFTATLLALLVENKSVNLTDKIEKFRPDLPFAKDITLLDLATHTSGLPSYPMAGLMFSHAKFVATVSNFRKADYERFLNNIKKPLNTGRFEYSNLGMALLGNILAEQLGVSYEEAIKQHLLLPLGMVDTHVSPVAYHPHRLAKGHSGSGKTVADFYWSCMEPAGVWRSTTRDMLLYLKAHSGHAGKAWQNVLNKTTSPIFTDPKLRNQGLAWQLENTDELGHFAWHNGRTFGQQSVVICLKDKESAIVVLSNKVPKFWQNFFTKYSLEVLSIDILQSLLNADK